MLSHATVLVSEMALAEASSHIGFIGGIFGEDMQPSKISESGRLRKIYAEVGIPLLERALEDWNLVPDGWREPSEKQPTPKSP